MDRVNLILLGNVQTPMAKLFEKLDTVLEEFKDKKVELVTDNIGKLHSYLKVYAEQKGLVLPRVYIVTARPSSRVIATDYMIKESLERGETVMVLFKYGTAPEVDLYIKVALHYNIKILYVDLE